MFIPLHPHLVHKTRYLLRPQAADKVMIYRLTAIRSMRVERVCDQW